MVGILIANTVDMLEFLNTRTNLTLICRAEGGRKRSTMKYLNNGMKVRTSEKTSEQNVEDYFQLTVFFRQYQSSKFMSMLTICFK